MQESSTTTQQQQRPVALVTGGARRLGAAITRCLHQAGMDVLIHYCHAEAAARELETELNLAVPGSAALIQQDLRHDDGGSKLIAAASMLKPKLDAVIHNASIFQASVPGEYQEQQWFDLGRLHLHSSVALALNAAPRLRAVAGCMVFITDIYARHPRASHSLYCASKAGMDMLVRCMAQQLAPEIRVNAVAPGAILWAEQDNNEQDRESITRSIPLGRVGEPRHIAAAVRFLVQQASYMTGATITVDGGRSLNLP